MGTPAQIGKPKYRALIVMGRQTTADLRRRLRRALSASKSAEARALLGAVAFDLGDLDAVLNELDEFGRTLIDE